MDHNRRHQPPSAKSFLSIRVNAEQKGLINQAAEREGLQVSSFIIMLLVREDILPESYLKRLKHCPVPFFAELHAILSVVNKISGNCNQLAAAMPNRDGLAQTQIKLTRAGEAITDAMHHRKVPPGVNLYRLQGAITQAGYAFNEIVKSVNTGRPDVTGLSAVLTAVGNAAEAITIALTGKRAQEPRSLNGEDGPVDSSEGEEDKLLEKAMEEMRNNMRKGRSLGD